MNNVDNNLEVIEERDETFQMLSWWRKEKVKAAKVMIVGAGALGNEVLKNLALMCVGNLLIVDYDKIEFSNLSRSVLFREKDCHRDELKAKIAAERIQEINPEINVETINGDITKDVGLGVFRRVDVVISCLDNRLARMSVNRSCYKVNKIWIDGGIEDLMGKASTYVPYESCYECELSDADIEIIKAKLGCPDVAKRNYAFGRIPTTPTSSAIAAAIQVQEALKVIHGFKDKLLSNKIYAFEGMHNEVGVYNKEAIRKNCLAHFTFPEVIEAKEIGHESSIEEALNWISNNLGIDDPSIYLDYPVILKVASESSENETEVIIPFLNFSEEVSKAYKVKDDDNVFITEQESCLSKKFPKKEITLSQVGIPALHIIRVVGEGKDYYVELTRDVEKIKFLK